MQRALLRIARAGLVRTLGFAGTLGGAAVAVQLLLALAPGDAIDLLPNADVVREGLAAEWGLDDPLPVRLAHTVGRVLTGDLGTSLTYRPGAPVGALVAQAGAQSLGLLLPAVALGTVLALAMAPFPALRRPVQVLSVVPTFVAAYGTVTVVNAVVWELIERGAIARPEWFALPDTASPVRWALAVTLLAVSSGALTELHAATAAELRTIREAGYVEAARARGEAVLPHIAVNLLPALASIVAGRAALAVGGLVVVEKVLLVNGAGAMLWSACQLRDYPLAIGLVLAAALAVAGTRLAADLVGVAVDPRRR